MENILANIKSSKKFSMKSDFKRKHNASNRSKLRTFIKKINSAIKEKDIVFAKSFFSIVQKNIDQQTSKGLIHKNKAARLKANILKRIKKYDLL